LALLRAASRPFWADLPDEELLDLRLRLAPADRGLALEPLLARLDHDFARKGIALFVPTRGTTSWFTPHGTTGFAIPSISRTRAAATRAPPHRRRRGRQRRVRACCATKPRTR
jgi:hypothetical protein